MQGSRIQGEVYNPYSYVENSGLMEFVYLQEKWPELKNAETIKP